MKHSMELVKSVLLLTLVVSSLALSSALWVQQPAALSLPPELQGVLMERSSVDLPWHLFQPTELIFHDGSASHAAIHSDLRIRQLAEPMMKLLQTLDPNQLQPLPAEEELFATLLRRQLQTPGMSFFFPGMVPLRLLLPNEMDMPDELRSLSLDRLLVVLDDDLELYMHTSLGWYFTHWTHLQALAEWVIPQDPNLPLAHSQLLGTELKGVTDVYQSIQEEVGFPGEPVTLLPTWGDVRIRPLTGIASLDQQASTLLASPATWDPRSFFPNFSAVRVRGEPESGQTFTDGFRRLQLSPDGGATYTLISPPDPPLQSESTVNMEWALGRAYQFLEEVMGGASERLRLFDLRPKILRGSLDLVTGNPRTSGYTFVFAQVFEDRLISPLISPITVTVDAYGVRGAELIDLQYSREVQRSAAVTPISGLNQVQRQLRAAGLGDELVLQRLDLVFYPEEMSGEERIIRTGWQVDLGPAGIYVVDAISGQVLDNRDE